jgi:hypothetical protein
MIDLDGKGKVLMITQDYLKECMHYDQETGVFTWLKSHSNVTKVGQKAGSLSGDGYLHIGVNKKRYKAHRLAFLYMEGSFPSECVDHINCIRTDNSWKNLRHATRQENNFNRAKTKNNKTGFKGVFYLKATNKFKAVARLHKKNLDLGSFDTAEMAYKAYVEVSKKIQGDYFHA